MEIGWLWRRGGIDRGRRHAVAARVCLCLALVASSTGFFVVADDVPASAHAPHDLVTDLAFSADFDISGRIFAIIRGRLMRSDDGGMSWHEIVRGLGGETQKLRDIAVSPADSDVVYTTSIDGALLRSVDGGSSWELLPAAAGVEASSLILAPDDPNVVFAFGPNTAVLARSADAGETWERPTLDGVEIAVGSGVALPDGRMLVGDKTGRILLSTDAGVTWVEQGRVDGFRPIRDLAVSTDPADRPVVFAATGDRRLLRSDDEGATFTEIGEGLPDEQLMSTAVSTSFADDDTVFVSTRDSGAYRSVDGGRTFEPLHEGLTRSPQADDVESPHFTTIATAPGESGIVLLAGFDGMFLLRQGSDTWVPVETLTGYIAGLALSPAFAEDRSLAVFTYVRGAFVSRDDGSTWELANGGLIDDAVTEGNRFAPLRRLHNVHFSPGYAEDQTLWGATWTRFIRSTDGGVSWEQIPVGDPPEGSQLRQFVLAASPDYLVDRTIFAGTRQGEFFMSERGGDRDSWEQLSSFETRVRSIVPSPAFADDRTIFVGTVGGLDRSTDGGRTWTDTGVRNEAEVTGREIDFGIQVAVSPDFANDGLVYAATDSGLFRSSDFGETFAEVRSGPLTSDELIEAVAFSPTFADDGLLLVSVRAVGLVRSTDGGATFESTAPALDEANLLIADYANPSSAPIQFSPTYAVDGTIYAYAQQALLRSTNRGEDWEVVDIPSVEEVLAALPPFEPAGDDSRLVTDEPSAEDPDSVDPGVDAEVDEVDEVDDVDGGSEADDVETATTPVDDDADERSNVWGVAALVAVLLVIGGLGFIVVRRSYPASP
ncbi:MAG: hypothetical protein R2707_10290 [Acidimicrobiales bacterium]